MTRDSYDRACISPKEEIYVGSTTCSSSTLVFITTPPVRKADAAKTGYMNIE